MLFTSFKAFPANCLCRFFMWEVFFFGTAFKIPSQISPRSPGMLRDMEDIERAAEGSKVVGRNCESCTAVLVWRSRCALKVWGSSS